MQIIPSHAVELASPEEILGRAVPNPGPRKLLGGLFLISAPIFIPCNSWHIPKNARVLRSCAQRPGGHERSNIDADAIVNIWTAVKDAFLVAINLGGPNAVANKVVDVLKRLLGLVIKGLASLVGISNLPQDKLDNICQVSAGEPVTLRFLIADYVEHMKKHLGQALNQR